MSPAPDTASDATRDHGSALPVGTRLRDHAVRRVVAEGRHGIVYLAFDRSLRREVALEEYLPRSFASREAGSTALVVGSPHGRVFDAGLRSFVDEARLLARFDHPSLVKVYRFWEENGTAYRVMPYLEGPTLETALASRGRPPAEGELRAWLQPLVDALAVLHDAGVWHQDIAPERIVMTASRPVLLGPALARRAIAAATHAPASALRPGFAAIEQYGSAAETSRGPWTDFYALGAVLRHALTGRVPPTAVERLARDTLEPLARSAPHAASTTFLAAIDGALALQPERRPRHHAEFRSSIGDLETRVARPVPVPRLDPMQQPFLDTQPFAEEITVPDRPLVAAAAAVHDPVTLPPLSKPMSLEAAALAAAATHWPPSGPAPLGRATTVPGTLPPAADAAPVAAGSGRARARRMSRRGALVAGATAGVGLAIAALVATFASRPPFPATAAQSAPAGAIAPAGAPTPPPAATGVAASVPPAALPTVAPAPMSVAEREARCVEILQRASLEGISAADTDFYKRECR